jgi:hypothetical protein
MILELGYDVVLVATYSPLLPLLILSARFRSHPPVYRWLAANLFLSLCCDIAAQILHEFHINPNVANNFYVVVVILFQSFFFYHANNQPSLKRPLVYLNVFYFIFAALNLAFVQKWGINSYSDIFGGLFVLAFCILFFYKLLKDLPTQQLHKLPLFWIISALFFSYAGKLVIYTFSHYLVHYVGDDLGIIWLFHNFLTIIGNVVIAYGAWLNHKQLRSTSLSL